MELHGSLWVVHRFGLLFFITSVYKISTELKTDPPCYKTRFQRGSRLLYIWKLLRTIYTIYTIFINCIIVAFFLLALYLLCMYNFQKNNPFHICLVSLEIVFLKSTRSYINKGRYRDKSIELISEFEWIEQVLRRVVENGQLTRPTSADQQRLSQDTALVDLIVISRNFIYIKLTKPIVTVVGLRLCFLSHYKLFIFSCMLRKGEISQVFYL